MSHSAIVIGIHIKCSLIELIFLLISMTLDAGKRAQELQNTELSSKYRVFSQFTTIVNHSHELSESYDTIPETSKSYSYN